VLDLKVINSLRTASMTDAVKYWDALEKEGKKHKQQIVVFRELCRADLFYLLVRACGREDMLHPWLYERVRDVEGAPDGYLDLWSREHYKSTVITFGLTLQEILKDPNVTIGIFSHTRPIAKAFMRQVMREMESNEKLHAAFPDVLWGKSLKDSPKWSEDDGIIVKRTSNPKEATVEAWGLVDGQPTSKHFSILMYDDVVVKDSVTTPDMIEKTMSALEVSYNLGTTPGRRRFAGTRWHFNDPYATIQKRGTVKVRVHPCSRDGTETGDPVLWTREQMAEKRRDMGPYNFSAQCLLNPKADALQGFKRDWIRTYKSVDHSKMPKYILVDAASSKKKSSDYTSMMVVALGLDQNYYVVDMVRDRLNLRERADRLFSLHRKWRPLEIRYERYGMMADIEHIKDRQEKENYRFEIKEVAGKTGKEDRIKRLLPIFEQGRMWFPQSMHVSDWEKVVRDLVHDFIEEEYMAFPVGSHDDMLDCLARIAEPEMTLAWPYENVNWSKKIVYPNLGFV